jgi:hypothetical protein
MGEGITHQYQDLCERLYFEDITFRYAKPMTRSNPRLGKWCLEAVPQLLVPKDQSDSTNMYDRKIKRIHFSYPK